MEEFIWHADVAADASQNENLSLQCIACGRTFIQSNAYSVHIRSCRPQKKRLASALDLAKEKYRRKKARLNDPPVAEPPLLQPISEETDPSTEVRASMFVHGIVHLRLLPQLRSVLLP